MRIQFEQKFNQLLKTRDTAMHSDTATDLNGAKHTRF